MKNELLSVGALGAVGRCVLEHCDKLPDWDLVGAARRRPDFETRADGVQVDLRDAADCRDKLAGLKDVTHIAYAAVYEKADVTRGWSELDHVEVNLQMLQNLLVTVEEHAKGLPHITLLQAPKAYGGHLGTVRQPSRASGTGLLPPTSSIPHTECNHKP